MIEIGSYTIVFSRIEDVDVPAGMMMSSHKASLDRMLRGRAIKYRILLKRGMSYGAFKNLQHVLFFFYALALVRKSAVRAVPGERKYYRVVEGEIDDYMAKTMHLYDLLDKLAKHVKDHSMRSTTLEGVAAMIKVFDPILL